ncbi:hypothetical protein COCCADRAFT_110873 [Bipolaris zeicola 26-R-13]|uniref:Major facilitator superfamily (MFS) profile domain-containing protein n=1 Tax=Cochliobolus carbonum (strain 26-R-13) TaxID=930089 RepID=W6XR15_COCC2|nr:uncharacterized protein COCCADRAFT_110873 [Bipolaris zeicola 26-R-13]EUC27750.1 hypothetical protein COCCADRAFT_110873 [Bipolaris zeicola 26-R-13]
MTNISLVGDVPRPSPGIASEQSEILSKRYLKAAFGSLCIIVLMVALDATSLAVALPVITKALEGSAVEAFWSGTSFLLASTIFQPILGSLSDVFGRKLLIDLSLLLFLIGSVVIATSSYFTTVLIGRTVQGAGGGGIICVTALIVVDKIPLQERGNWLSLLGAVFSVGNVSGPLLGGALAKETLWRWIFWINLPLIGIGGISIAIFLKVHKRPGSFVKKLNELDWVGMGLFLTSTTGFLIPISRGGIEYPWSSWHTLIPLLLCTAGLVALAIHQEYVAKRPFIHTDVFKNRSAAIILLLTVLYGLILSAVLFYLPLYFEAVKNMSPIMAGVAIFPWTLTLAPSAMVTGIVISKTRRYRWANWLGWCFSVVGMSLLVLLKEDTPTIVWIVVSLVGGAGMGTLYPAMMLGAQASSSVENQAYATNIFTFLRALGQTFGVTIGGIVFQSMLERKMLSNPLLSERAREYSKDAVGLVQIIKAMPDIELKVQLKESFVYALTYIWVVVAVLSGVALIASLFIKGYDINSPSELHQSTEGN